MSPTPKSVRAARASAIALAAVLFAAAACRKKADVQPLGKDDGKLAKQECELAVGGVIASSAVIKAGCVVAVGEKYSIGKGATLTIESGARLSFKKGASLEVNDGALVVKGTALQPVVFTSAEAAPVAGDWGGIVLSSTARASTFEHATIEFGGTAERGALHIASGATKHAITGSTFRDAPRVGLTADGPEPFERFSDNTFAKNGALAMDVSASALGAVTSIAADEPVRVHGKVTKSQTWPAVSAGIVVGSLVVVSPDPGPVLTLAPDSVVRVEPGVRISLGHYSESGSLVATRVRFTSAAAKPAPGDWGGIHFGKRAPGTAIDGCIIEYAGHTDAPPPAKLSKGAKKPTAPVALSILESMKDFKVVNTTFRNNAGPGMGLNSSTVFVIGTGGCEGLDAPKNGNKSIGQPLCEYHEDPFGALGMLGGPGDLSALMIAGPDPALFGKSGGGLGGGLGAPNTGGGAGSLGGIGGLGHGSGMGGAGATGLGKSTAAAGSKPSTK